jgi:hypothetical protein
MGTSKKQIRGRISRGRISQVRRNGFLVALYELLI